MPSCLFQHEMIHAFLFVADNDRVSLKCLFWNAAEWLHERGIVLCVFIKILLLKFYRT